MKVKNPGVVMSGLCICVIGLAHLLFPNHGYGREVRAFFCQNAEIADHFYYLATYALCSFLLFIGALTLIVGSLGDQYTGIVRAYCLLSVLLWSTRLALELVYPVEVKLFGMDNLSMKLIVTLIVIISGFIVGIFKTYSQGQH